MSKAVVPTGRPTTLLTAWTEGRLVADPALDDTFGAVLADWIRFAADEAGLPPATSSRPWPPASHTVSSPAAILEAHPTGAPRPPRPATRSSPTSTVEPAPFVWRDIPAQLHDQVEAIVADCDRVCETVLDGEYQHLARRLVAKLAWKRPSPLRRGEPTIWAAGFVHRY